MLILSIRAAAFAAAACLLAACFPTTGHPIRNTTGATNIDTVLAGKWKGVDEDGNDYIEIAPVDGKDHFRIYFRTEGEAEPRTDDAFDAWYGTVGDAQFLSVRPVAEMTPEDWRGYMVFQIFFEGADTLQLKAAEHPKLAALIEAKKIEGEIVRPNSDALSVHITASAEAFEALIRAEGADKIFTDESEAFRRQMR